MKIKIYDPRRGEDFVFNNRPLNKSFSSLRHGFFVADSQDQAALSRRVDLLKECIPKTSNLGFFVVALWMPGAKRLKAAIRQQCGDVCEFANSLCGYFDLQSIDPVDKLLALRDTFGGNKGGEWGFGGCLTKFRQPQRISLLRGESWHLTHLLDNAEKLGCLLFLGDGYTTFMTRMFDGVDAALSQFYAPSNVADDNP